MINECGESGEERTVRDNGRLKGARLLESTLELANASSVYAAKENPPTFGGKDYVFPDSGLGLVCAIYSPYDRMNLVGT